jgi:hypothetical protein
MVASVNKCLPEYLNRYSFLVILYAFFVSGFFLIPNAVDLYKIFIYAVLPVFVVTLRDELLRIGRSRLFLAVIAYIIYMTLTSFWSEPFVWKQFSRHLALSISVAGFVSITAWCFHRSEDDMVGAMKSIWVLVCLSAIVSIFYWYGFVGKQFPDSRLVSIGVLDNPNSLGIVYALFALIGIHFLTASETRAPRYGWAAGTALLVIAVVFTASRNAMISLVAASVLLIVIQIEPGRKLKWAIALVFGWGIVLAVVGYLFGHFLWHRFVWMLDHGFSDRPEIWSAAFSDMGEAWLFGKGYLTPFSAAEHHWMHSIYLATLRDGGVVGLLLLVSIVYQSFVILARRSISGYGFLPVTMLFLAVLSQAVDGDQLLQRPKEIWLLFWLPVGIAVHRQMRSQV